MNRPQKHTVQSSDGKYNYLLFDSVFAFNAFVDDEVKQLSSTNASRWNWVKQSTSDQLNNGTDWYGTPTPKDTSELEEHKIFLGMKLVEKIQPQIKGKISKYLEYLQNSVLPKPKISYNDRGLGVFSFERAAMGMYQQFPVNTSTPITTSVSQMNIELRKKQLLTSVKSVYAYFQDKKSSYPSLQLYIMSGANAQVKGNDLLYVGLACAELVEFMELRGISVEVNVMLGTSFNNQVAMACIRVKRFQDKLDKNQLLLISSDPRYFRYRGFKGLVALSNYFGLRIPSGLGTISASMGDAFAKAINEKGFVFEQSYSMESAVKEVSQIIINYKKQLDGNA
ncbi:hypothetical protein R5N98_12615 [Tenacibaculum maritimum]|uniref:DUF7192 family protein n=1 Tax=Tenacibaculum maritimum TaxID=107401 RepID=UPI00388F979D